MRKPYNLNLDTDLMERVDAAAGDVPRSRFVERALEAALGGANPGRTDDGPAPVAPGLASPASPRTSEPSTVRHCSRCMMPIPSPSLLSHPGCGGKIVPPPKGN